tara:strand:+ start:635 stop:850 length:216 start_codon:yes stop_codon:yes gene_type:complete
MKFNSIYFLLATIILLLISSFSYDYFFSNSNSSNEILFIESNLDQHRIIPEDKGGLDDPCLNLEVCNIGNE